MDNDAPLKLEPMTDPDDSETFCAEVCAYPARSTSSREPSIIRQKIAS